MVKVLQVAPVPKSLQVVTTECCSLIHCTNWRLCRRISDSAAVCQAMKSRTSSVKQHGSWRDGS